MKKNTDGTVSELLNKLQAAYSAPSRQKQKTAKKKKIQPSEDAELERKLRDALNEVTPTPHSRSKTRRGSETRPNTSEVSESPSRSEEKPATSVSDPPKNGFKRKSELQETSANGSTVEKKSSKKTSALSEKRKTQKTADSDVPNNSFDEELSEQILAASTPNVDLTEQDFATSISSAERPEQKSTSNAPNSDLLEPASSTNAFNSGLSEKKSPTAEIQNSASFDLTAKDATSVSDAEERSSSPIERSDPVSSDDGSHEDSKWDPTLKTSDFEEKEREGTATRSSNPTRSFKRSKHKRSIDSTVASAVAPANDLESEISLEPSAAEKKTSEDATSLHPAPNIASTTGSVLQTRPASEPSVPKPGFDPPTVTCSEETAIPTEHTISHAPDSVPTAPQPKKSEPIRIVPKNKTAPESPKKAPLRSAEQPTEPIVILPPKISVKEPQPRSAQEAIVIRPEGSRTEKLQHHVIFPTKKDVAPIPTATEQQPVQQKPIPIGKKGDTAMNKKTNTSDNATENSPAPSKKSSVTMVPHDHRFSGKGAARSERSDTLDPTISSPSKRDSREAKSTRLTAKNANVVTSKQTHRQAEPIPDTVKKEKTTQRTAEKNTASHPNETAAKTAPVKNAGKQHHPQKKKPVPHPDPESRSEEGLDEVLEELPRTEQTVADPETAFTPSPQASESPQSEDREAFERTLYDTVRRKSGLTEDDIMMMFELGYENELGRAVGYETLKKLKSEHLRQVSRTHRKHYRTAFGYRGVEYGGTQDREKVLAAYHTDRILLVFRMIATAVLTLLLLFVDMPQIIGASFTAALASKPFLTPLLEQVLLTLCALASIRRINAGIRQFYKFAPTPYSVCGIVIPLAFLYNLAACFLPLPAMSFAFALVLLMTVFCDVLRMNCELRSFAILSAEGKKTVLEPTVPRKKKLRQGDRIVKIVSDEIGEPAYRVCTAEETVGFFRRFNRMESASKPFMILLFMMLAFAVAAAFLAAILTLSLAASVQAAVTVLAICAPIPAIFSYFYPLFRANKLLSHCNCTLIGEEGVEEFDREKTVIFADTDLFGATTHSETLLQTNEHFETDRSFAEALFRKLGGTLGQLVPCDRPASKISISVIRVTDGGVEAIAENRHHILLGNEAFLNKNGIKVPKESSDRTLRRTADIALMYMAVDGSLRLKYEIRYAVNTEFEEKIEELAFYKTAVGIQTYDPNITEGFLAGIRGETAEPVRVIYPGRFDENSNPELSDTGAICMGAAENITATLYTAVGIGAARRFGMRMQIISSSIGFGATVLFLLLQSSPLPGILAIAAYQLFGVLVSFLATHSELNRATLHLNR